MNFDAVKNSLVREARAAGLEEYEIYFMESGGTSAETLKGEISSFSCETSGGISFRCIYGGKLGSAATQLFTDEEMKALVERAIENAKYVESDDKAVIFSGSESYAELDLPEIEEKSTAELKQIALSLHKDIYAQSEYVSDGTSAFVMQNKTNIVLMNSHGLELCGKVGVAGAGASAVVSKDGEAQEAFSLRSGFAKEDLEAIPKDSVADALKKLGATEIESGKYDVIIDGKQMRTLLSTFSSVFSGRSANLGLSLLKGKEGEQIAAECVTIVDDPMYKGSAMQTSFDGEGVATYTKNVVEKGVLKTLLYDIASADKVGKESTGNGQRAGYASPVSVAPYHFYLSAGELDDEALLGALGDGLYITELKGLHAGANSVTGDFSIESAGFRVRDGKLCEAVKSFTIAGNFFELIKSVESLSSNVKFGFPSGFTVFGAPDTLIRKMSVAGK
ncbi:MAG: TldD/PmbA family protein [Ruminococcaceae bacterium]|nr:TldD/PmbA family protein [Oscillospiraceae bacterium]